MALLRGVCVVLLGFCCFLGGANMAKSEALDGRASEGAMMPTARRSICIKEQPGTRPRKKRRKPSPRRRGRWHDEVVTDGVRAVSAPLAVDCNLVAFSRHACRLPATPSGISSRNAETDPAARGHPCISFGNASPPSRRRFRAVLPPKTKNPAEARFPVSKALTLGLRTCS